jgi:hypothetical protein
VDRLDELDDVDRFDRGFDVGAGAVVDCCMEARRSVIYRIQCEEDGPNTVAEVLELPGATSTGSTRKRAIRAAKALALRILSEAVERDTLEDSDVIEFEVLP